MSYYLAFNGATMPLPKSYSWTINDIDGKSTRNAAGRMSRDRITSKIKLTIEWGPLSDVECSKILQAIKDPFFKATYLDAQAGGMVTKTFYVGDRTSPAYSWNDKLKKYTWSGLSFDIIEQ
ncbi:DUF6711 family protein [Levilactobacillus enshiensis]|uniref:DUF6711 family protein n=1 Tax=Levilactobacillus enshiensis TaxID=2590213 RepID=UPI001179CB4D|nr:DUF6711 family protein [Levilactobacillus enshiensis]